jgi:hypothetical protein
VDERQGRFECLFGGIDVEINLQLGIRGLLQFIHFLFSKEIKGIINKNKQVSLFNS